MNGSSNNETTLDDILEAINESSTVVENRLTNVETHLSKVETHLSKMERDITTIQATMVTKEYLDTKLADLRGDLVVMMRKEDTKLKTLVEVLQARNIISAEDVKRILSLEPFAQLAI